MISYTLISSVALNLVTYFDSLRLKFSKGEKGKRCQEYRGIDEYNPSHLCSKHVVFVGGEMKGWEGEVQQVMEEQHQKLDFEGGMGFHISYISLLPSSSSSSPSSSSLFSSPSPSPAFPPIVITLSVHHLVIDALSWDTLLSTFHRMIFNEMTTKINPSDGQKQLLPLAPPLRNGVYDRVSHLQQYVSSPFSSLSLPHWSAVDESLSQLPAFPLSLSETLSFSIPSSLVSECERVCASPIAHPFLSLPSSSRFCSSQDLYFCAFLVAMRSIEALKPLICPSPSLTLVFVETHGRDPLPTMKQTKKQRQNERDWFGETGWFTSLFPIQITTEIEGEKKGTELENMDPIEALFYSRCGFSLSHSLSHSSSSFRACDGASYGAHQLHSSSSSHSLPIRHPNALFNFVSSSSSSASSSSFPSFLHEISFSKDYSSPPLATIPFEVNFNHSYSGEQHTLQVDITNNPSLLPSPIPQNFVEKFTHFLENFTSSFPPLNPHSPLLYLPSHFISSPPPPGEWINFVHDCQKLAEKRTCSVSIGEILPLQMGMVLHSEGLGEGIVERGEEQEDVYWTYTVFDVGERVGKEDLKESWEKVIQRHESLRSGLMVGGWGGVVGVVMEREAILDIEGVWEVRFVEGGKGELEEKVERERRRGMGERDLGLPPLMKFVHFVSGSGGGKLLWCCHHAIVDGWSTTVIEDEVVANLLKQSPPQQHQPLQLRQYASQLNQTHPPALAFSWWLSHLPVLSRSQTILQPHSIPSSSSPSSSLVYTFTPAPSVLPSLLSLSSRCGVTLCSLIQTVWMLLLWLFCRSGGEGGGVCFGLCLSGRVGEVEGVEEVVGLLVNTLPFFFELSNLEQREVQEIVRGVWKRVGELEENQNISLGEIEERVLREVSDDSSSASLFNTLFIFENYEKNIMSNDVGKQQEPLFCPTFNEEKTEFDYTVLVFPEPLTIRFLAKDQVRLESLMHVKIRLTLIYRIE